MVVPEALPSGMRMRRILITMVFVGLISSRCAGGAFIPQEKGGKEDRDTSHYISDVPFFPQARYQCGPASLASVLNYYGCRITPEEIADAIFRRELKGTLSIDLILFAQRMGFEASAYRGTVADLQGHVAGNRPLIVFQNVGDPFLSLRHYSVVIGYDDTKGIIILHSGKHRDKVISYDRFLRSWEEMDYWTLLILPRGGVRN
jgi:ABC-type bacteriocin/lantibiotic exporter with double-glycine peptidase domain